jgi:tetratricopeptide (TPR) repeat protein
MSSVPSSLDRELAEALEFLQLGEGSAAEARLRALLIRHPKHRDLRVLLGTALHFQRRFDDAADVFQALAAEQPDEAAHWANLGAARRGAKRYDEALKAYGIALQGQLPQARVLYEVGLTHIDRLDLQSARAVLARAAMLDPYNAEIRYRYADTCSQCQQKDEGVRALAGWQQLNGLTSELLADIGSLLLNLGDSAGAEQALQQAAADPDPSPQALLSLVQAFERTNRLPQARAWLDRLREHAQAPALGTDLALAEARVAEREGLHEQAIGLLQGALADVSELHGRKAHLFPLAKSLDALGRCDEAFAAATEAHRSQVEWLRLTAPAATLRSSPILSVTSYHTDPEDLAAWDTTGAPALENSPVFVVGFPRSGTTLLELTLDAHPALVAMDEQPFLRDSVLEIQKYAQYPDRMAAMTPAQLDEVRAAYWARVGQRVRLAPGQRLVDKNPLNILRLPVMRRLFPHSRIILAVRHPCDVLLSNFLQHFAAPEFALLCADLTTLATAFTRIFDFWYREQDVLKAAVRELRYETLVENFEGEVRAISDFLQLPWDERMLSPAANALAKRYISTPSYSQVVQPVNRRSVGRWQHYRRHFEPVLPLLRPYLQRWDYGT